MFEMKLSEMICNEHLKNYYSKQKHLMVAGLFKWWSGSQYIQYKHKIGMYELI